MCPADHPPCARHPCRPDTQWVVQKYIERPLLIGGRKFDIRSYVLLAPDHKVYMFRESYVRTSSTPFDIANLADRWVRWCTMGDGSLACTSLPCRLLLGIQGAAVCCQAALSSLSVLTALESAPAAVHARDKQDTSQTDECRLQEALRSPRWSVAGC